MKLIHKKLVILGLSSGIVVAIMLNVSIWKIAWSQPIPEDPPKKEIKKDTTKINIKQMQKRNKNAQQQIYLLDSLIMKIDTSKMKK